MVKTIRLLIFAALVLYPPSASAADLEQAVLLEEVEAQALELSDLRQQLAAILGRVLERIDTITTAQGSCVDDLSRYRHELTRTTEDVRSLEQAVSQPIYFFHAKEKKQLTNRALRLAVSQSESTVRLGLNEPTVIEFPEKLLGGFRGTNSKIAVDRTDEFLILILKEALADPGEALVVRGKGGDYYAIRAKQATNLHPRDVQVRVSQ